MAINLEGVPPQFGQLQPGSYTIDHRLTRDDDWSVQGRAVVELKNVEYGPELGAVTITPSVASLGTTFTATVEATGSPEPALAYSGELDGVRVATASGPSFAPAAPGRLRAVVTGTNTLGSATRESVVVTVVPYGVAPVLTTVTLSPASGQAGTVFAAAAEVLGEPAPSLEYRWQLDGREIAEESSAIWMPTDPGSLIAVVTARNQVGSTTCASAAATVTRPDEAPEIASVVVAPATGDMDSTYTAAAEITGMPVPPASYQWMLNGTDIADATAASIAPTAAASLSVMVTASNSAGVVKRDSEAVHVTEATAAPAGTAVGVSPSNGKVGTRFRATVTAIGTPDSTLPLSGRYVASSGLDSNDGSYSKPWATLQHGWSRIAPGETLWVLDTLTPAAFSSPSEAIVLSGNGTSKGSKILRGYNGQKVIDFKEFRGPSWGGTGIRVISSFAQLIDIHVRNVAFAGGYIDGINWRGANGRMENCEVSGIRGRGVTIGENGMPTNMQVINCDIHDCHDPQSRYGNADGIQVFSPATGIVIESCRIWRCSDDGIDLYFAAAPVTVRNCWSWGHGYREDGKTAGGDGTGLKVGGTGSTSAGHIVERNLVFDVRGIGINNNGNTRPVRIYRNSVIGALERTYGAYDNKVATMLIANVKYGGGTNSVGGDDVAATRNSWNNPPKIGAETTGWFQSLSRAGVDGPRRPEGSLPRIAFARPGAGSALIGKGPAGETLGAFDHEPPTGT